MSWIEQVPIVGATGLLKKIYDEAKIRAASFWKIGQIMGSNPPVLKASLDLYLTTMKGQSPLSRIQREVLATVVASELDCDELTQSHANDLRQEVGKVMTDDSKADAFVHAIVKDWRSAPLSTKYMALCQFAAKLTLLPRAASVADIHELREQGFSDRAIHDAVQIVAYFNYLTRFASALGADPEMLVKTWGEEKDE